MLTLEYGIISLTLTLYPVSSNNSLFTVSSGDSPNSILSPLTAIVFHLASSKLYR